MSSIKIILPFTFCLLFSAPVFSNSELKLTDGVELYKLTPYVSYYVDNKSAIKIENILKLDKKGVFFRDNDHNPNFGGAGTKVWGKFQWRNESSKKNEWLLIFDSERLEEVNVYIVSADKVISSMKYDYHQKFSERLINHRKLIFPLPNPESFQTVYFNAKTAQLLELSSAIATPLALAHKNYQDMFIIGLYYGIMFSMIIYNIFILFATKDKTYFFYIIYVFCYTIVQSSVDGLLHELIFPDSYEYARDFRIYSTSVALAAALLFAVSLLQIKNYYPKLYSFYILLIPVCLLPGVIQYIFGYQAFIFLLVYILIFICSLQIVAGFILSFKVRIARYYLAAWIIFLCGMLIQQLKSFNIYIPFFSHYNYALQLGSAAEALLLSLALSYRINLMRQSLIEKDNELLNAKFTNLKDKMNPHFVLNTLSIIISYLKKDVNKANAALNYFAAGYKYLIKNENEHLALLENEIQFTKDYGNILLIKYADTLKIHYKISGELSNIMIPFLSLQPIVENAFKHGLRKIEKGEIQIKIKVTGLKVDIVVTNSSNGAEIKNPFKGTLGAIKRRIQYFFEDGELTINDNGNETIVKIHYMNKIEQENLIAVPVK